MIRTIAASMAMVLSSSTLFTLWLSSKEAMGMRILRIWQLLRGEESRIFRFGHSLLSIRQHLVTVPECSVEDEGVRRLDESSCALLLLPSSSGLCPCCDAFEHLMLAA
jgi:hypothetical protein